jgi:hypothetical protein
VCASVYAVVYTRADVCVYIRACVHPRCMYLHQGMCVCVCTDMYIRICMTHTYGDVTHKYGDMTHLHIKQNTALKDASHGGF